MKLSQTAIFGASVLVAASLLYAQQPQSRPTGPAGASGTPGVNVAVVDFNHILQNYSRAKGIRASLTKDGGDAEAALRKENLVIEQKKEKLKEFRAGTLEYKNLEEDIARQSSELKVRAALMQRDFMERQNKSMYDLYREISEEVKLYSQAHGITLVFPYSSEPIDPNSPQSLQQAMSNPFIYQGGPDITVPILESMNRRAVTASSTNGRSPRGPATRKQ